MKILYITTISLTINTFFKPHIDMLVNEGNHVDIACNYSNLAIDPFYKELGCESYQIDFSRSPLSFSNIKAYKQLCKVIERGNYDIVHCHTPNASIITRLVCRKFRKKNGLKVFYTAHGFHFYKGAPKLNWIIYYPVEKFCSRFTDKLITINHEDYTLAKLKLNAKEVHYVPGVGIDLSKFKDIQFDKAIKRQEIGVPEDAFLLFSVGELNENKNHQVIIKALAKLSDPSIHYAIAGSGENKEYLIELSRELGVSEQVHLLGYRTDIAQLNFISDVFCFPSIREGLGLAAVEGMACGLPVIASDNRGTREYMSAGENGFVCHSLDPDAFAKAIETLKNDKELVSVIKQNNEKRALDFSQERTNLVLKEIYGV